MAICCSCCGNYIGIYGELKIRSQGSSFPTFTRGGEGRAGLEESEESAPRPPQSLRCRDRTVSHGTYNLTNLNWMRGLLPWLSSDIPCVVPGASPFPCAGLTTLHSCDSLALAFFSEFICCWSISHQNQTGLYVRAIAVCFMGSCSPS